MKKNMNEKKNADIYARMFRNRIRLVFAMVILMLAIMASSGFALYLLRDAFDIDLDFWLLWTLFWMLCLLYIILRYAIGGRWMLKCVKTLPPWKRERRLGDALTAASLASGIDDRIHLFVIPDNDINSFSLSLPDGTFALFATQGVSRKLPLREREAIMAHEIAHIQSGDTTIYTIMLRMAGNRSLKRMVRGLPGTGFDPIKLVGSSFLASLMVLAAVLFVVGSISTSHAASSSGSDFWLFLAALFIALLALLPIVLNLLLRLALDRNREYHADMHAVYLTRDPGAVYQAVKLAAEDVRDVILLPASFDALLFHPVVDFSSYRPYRTQPTMARRMERLREAFPVINA